MKIVHIDNNEYETVRDPDEPLRFKTVPRTPTYDLTVIMTQAEYQRICYWLAQDPMEQINICFPLFEPTCLGDEK